MGLLALTLFGSTLVLGIAVAVLFIALILSDINESGTLATVSFGVFVGLNYFWGNLPLLQIFTIYNILMYVFIGFIFALIRTYFKGRELTSKDKRFYDLRDSVLRWWFLFPISLINWVFGKLLVNVYNLLYDKTEKIFERLFYGKDGKEGKENIL